MRAQLKDLQAGQNYKIQVRSNDGEAVSEWSMIYDLTTAIDNIAPSVPTSFAVVQEGTTSIITWVAPGTNTDGSLLKDFDHYDVEAYSDGVTSVYRTGIERFEFGYEYNLTAFGQYKNNTGFRVRAVDQSGNASAWTTRTFGVDLPPSRPAVPLLLKDLTDLSKPRLFIRHNLTKHDGTGRIETDVNRIRIYSTNSASTNPTVLGSTLLQTMIVSGSSVFAISGTMNLNDYLTKHIFVVATDIAGNDSATSETAPVASASSALYADVAVIGQAYIDYLEANRVVAGTGFIDNITIKSSFIMGAARDGSAPADADASTIPVPITQTVARSAGYKYGLEGWIIRGDGYAEFRNLAVNSLNIGKFDQVTQSVMSTKFADFMEDSELWGRHTTSGNEEETGGTPYDAGTFIGETNADGAYSARAMLSLTGKTSVRRKSAGLNRGISFEPGQVYKVWARVRQLTGPMINAINNPTFVGDTTNANTGDTAGDGVANYWREYSSITATKSLVAASGLFTVTTAQRASGSVAAGGYVGFRANTPLINSGVPNQNALPVAAGLEYALSAYVKASAMPTVGTSAATIEWYDAAGAFLSASADGTAPFNGTGFWHRMQVNAIAPVGAVYAAPRLRVISSTAGTLTVDFTAAMLTQTSGTEPYFDGSFTNSAWSGTAFASPSYETHTTKYRIGVLGFDDAGNLCAADGSTSADPEDHYMVAADGTTDLPVFDGTNSQSAGWIEVAGYIKDRTDELTPPGAHNDPYNPAGVHKNVRFIVPFVQMNINDNGTVTDYVAQLDMFSVESSNTLAPVVIKTGVSKGITIQDLDGDDWAHAIRFYSGNDDEKSPGLFTEIQDQDFNQAHSLIISPPQTIPGDRTSLSDGMRLRGRNANLISNSSFENTYRAVVLSTDWETYKFSLGFSGITTRALDSVNYHQGWGEKSIKLTSTGAGNVYLYHHLLAYKFPELLGQTKVTASAWVRNDPANPGALGCGFAINTYNDAGTRTADIPAFGTLQTTSIPDDGEWYRISYVFDFSTDFPDGFPDETTVWDVEFGFVATGAGQIVNFDDIQLEVGDTLTDYKPQTPSSVYMPGAGMILGDKLVISNRIKSFDEMANSRWNPMLDYETTNPAIVLENDGMLGTVEKVSAVSTATGFSESYMAFRIYDDQGAIQAPWMQIKDSNDESAPNTVQFLNQSQQLMGYWGSLADPTNPEANAAGKDLVVKGAFRAEGYPNWTTGSIGTNLVHTAGAYPFSTHNSNGVTYMRGSVANTSGVNSGPTIIAIPTAHRPLVTAFVTVSVTSGSGAGNMPRMYVLQITSAGSGTIRNGTNTVLVPGEIMFFDGTFFSTAGTATVTDTGGGNPAVIGAATQPSSLTITPYASSLTTGTYRIGWVNANDADNAKLRIVWRVDRTPNGANDGNIVTVTTVNNSAQSYLLSGLPVGRRIYVRLYAINKAGVYSAGTAPSASRFLLASPTVVYANSSASYRDGYGGMWRNDGDQVYQGEWTGNDNHRGLFFYGTQVYDRLNLGGVARTPTKMTIFLQRTGSGGIYGAVPIDLYPTALATKPAGAPSIVTSQTAGSNIVSLKTNQGATITIPSLWYPVYATGTYKGFAIYNAGSDYAVLYGRSANSAHGKLTIYHKG